MRKKLKKNDIVIVDKDVIIGSKFNNAVWHLFAYTVTDGVAQRSSGTGFLFKVKLRVGKSKRYTTEKIYLVSNKHVLVSDNPQVLYVRFLDSATKQPCTYQLTTDLQSEVLTLNNIDADLAMVDVTDKIHDILLTYNMEYGALDATLMPWNWDEIGQEKPCTFIGYPLGTDTRPLPGGGLLAEDASDPENDPEIKLYKSDVSIGASGSPAFIKSVSLNEPRFFGIVTKTGSRPATATTRREDLGYVVKVTALKALFDQVLGENRWR